MRTWGTEYQGVFGFIQNVDAGDAEGKTKRIRGALETELPKIPAYGLTPFMVAAAVFMMYSAVVRAFRSA